MNLDKEKSYLIEQTESKYLKAAELDDNFTARLTIKSVDEETFENDKGEESFKLVLFFTGKDKGITLSTTNARTLLGAFGAETDAWYGKEILLTTKFYPKFSTSGFIVNAIPESDDPDDDIPF